MDRPGDSGVTGGIAAQLTAIRQAWAARAPVVVETSGTTGRPRLVEHGPPSVEASCRAVSRALAVDPDRDRWLACIPLRFVAGRAVVLRGEVTGTPVTVHDGFAVDRVGDEAGTCTLVSLVATQLVRLLDARAPIHRFRAVLLGGGPVPAGLLARAGEAGVVVHTTYGLTETFGGCVHDGHPLDGVSIRLAPDTDEVQVRGSVLMRGYVDDPEATRAAFTDDGWFRTGDVGRLAADGRLEIVDRLKDLVITGAVNVSPTAVERVVSTHPAFADVCVIGVPDAEWGERVVCCAVLAPGATPPSLDALRDFARERLAPAELPRELRLVGAIPRTPGGKPLRRELR
jgi:O-succinylbenzoic acid--CoA ligase